MGLIFLCFFFSSRRRHTRSLRDWSSDVCSSDLERGVIPPFGELYGVPVYLGEALAEDPEIILSAGTHSDCRAHGRMWISSTLPSLASARLPRNASHSLHLAPSVLQHFAGCAGAARDADFLVPLVTCRKRLS